MNINWIRCNGCFAKMIKAEKPFSLTQCGHIFCSKCMILVQKQCPQCKTVGVLSMSLNIPLDPRVMPYFTSIDNTLEEVRQSIKFQSSQCSIIMARFDELEEKYTAIKKEYWTMMQKIDKLTKKIKIMYAEMHEQNMGRMKREHLVPSTGSLSNNIIQDIRSNYSLLVNNNKAMPAQDTKSSAIHFTPEHHYQRQNRKDTNIFRVPSSTKVPRSIHQRSSSESSANSQTRTPIFSDYSNYSR